MYLTVSMIRRILLNLYLLLVFLRSSVNLQVYTDKSMESFEFRVISYFSVQVEEGASSVDGNKCSLETFRNFNVIFSALLQVLQPEAILRIVGFFYMTCLKLSQNLCLSCLLSYIKDNNITCLEIQGWFALVIVLPEVHFYASVYCRTLLILKGEQGGFTHDWDYLIEPLD